MGLELEWDAVCDEAERHFRALLRLDTTNPPGNEHLAVAYVKEVLDREGIASTVVEPAPGRQSLVARLSGKRSDTGLLMTSHTDVVPADREHWRTDPFSADVLDGDIYGRGAIDMKNMTAYSLAALLAARRGGWPLEHDLVMSCFADEEAGCTQGSRYVVEHHPDLLAARYALNEVGAFTLHLDNGARLYPIQVVEKGFIWLRMRATGEPGHGSMPHDQNAVVKLARAVDKLDRISTPLKVHPVVDAFMDEMGSSLGGVSKLFLKLARNPALSDLVVKKIIPRAKRKTIYASLHDTVNPTGLAAGKKVNVIPSHAEVTLDCRVLPGTTLEELIAEIEAIVGPGFSFEVIERGMALPMEFETPMLDALKATVERNDPGAKAVPYMLVGFSDSAELSKLGIAAYGFAPTKIPAGVDFASLFHGHDERISVDGFRWGVRTFVEAVHDYVLGRV